MKDLGRDSGRRVSSAKTWNFFPTNRSKNDQKETPSHTATVVETTSSQEPWWSKLFRGSRSVTPDTSLKRDEKSTRSPLIPTVTELTTLSPGRSEVVTTTITTSAETKEAKEKMPTSLVEYKHSTIFRKPTPLPEEAFIDINCPIDDTTYLARVLQELPEGSARKEPLELLSHQVVEQFGLRLVRTPTILQEVIALSSIPDAELLHKILQQFLNLLDREAALDVDLLEGLAILLETANPNAMRAKSPQSDEKEAIAPEEKSTADKLKEGLIEGTKIFLEDNIGEVAAPLVSMGVSALGGTGKGIEKGREVIGSLRKAFGSVLQKKGLLKKEHQSEDSTSLSEKAESKRPEKLSPTGSYTHKYSQIAHLMQLLDKLVDKYQIFHRQAQTALQEAELLRALARVLDAMRDIGVTGISKEDVRKKVYDALADTANDSDTDPAVSLWANYALQALIRLEDDGSVIGEWIQRGKNLVTVIKSVKEVWNSWDLSQLGEAYAAGKEAFKVDHQPESWYESLWYCQLLIRAGQFQALEEYLYQDKSDQPGHPLCPDRCMPTFQLGLIAALNGVIRDPQWSETVKSGCLQLLQDLFLNEAHWYTEPEQSKDEGWKAYLSGKVGHAITAAKKFALYTGQAYRARKEAVQGAILEQMVQYLDEPALCQPAQGVLSALRHPSIKPPLTDSQSQLLEERAPLAKILKVSQSTSTSAPAKPSQVLLLPAREAVEKHLAWRLETLRAHVLTVPETERALAYYVPPKSLRKDQDKDPPFDLMEGSLYFLGLVAEDPADKRVVEVKERGDEKDSKGDREKKYASTSISPWSTVSLTRGTLDCRRTMGAVNPAFVAKWRRTYGSDATRFLLVYCEDVADNSKVRRASQADRSSHDPDQVTASSGSWYFCGQTGEGEYLEGPLQAGKAWLKYITPDARQCLTALMEDLTQLETSTDPITSLKDPQSAVSRQLKVRLVQGLNHLAVVNGKSLIQTSPKQQVLLLTAGAGSGKSTYGLYLQRFLWQHYQSGGYIPLFISLVQLTRPDKPFIEEVLKQKGLTDSDIRVLKDPAKGYRFLFIFDGYDELTSLKGQNLFTINKLHEWPHCQVIIGCRAELLSSTAYEKWFAPTDEKGKLQSDKLLTRWVAPFDATQTQNYLKKYVRQKREQQVLTGEAWDGWTNWQLYQDEINKLSSIRQLIERPFMLTILVEILPAMKREREESLGRISRLDLYDMFMQQWFKRAKDKLTPAMLEHAKRHGKEQFQFHEGETIEADYQEFCENLALYLFEHGQSAALYQRQWAIQKIGRSLKSRELDRFFKTSDPAVDIVLRGCPIIRQSANRYGYIHKSIWEYFMACRIYHELTSSPVPWEPKVVEKTVPEQKVLPATTAATQPYSTVSHPLVPKEHQSNPSSLAESHKKKVRFKMRRIISPILSLYQQILERRAASGVLEDLAETDATQLLLNQRSLQSEPSIIRFLADYAQRDERFQRTLLHWVYCSRRRPDLSMASANAITILNAARFPFSGMNLSGIDSRGADLSQGIFDHTNFTGADLRGVNFDQAFLKDADFKESQLKGAYFGSVRQTELVNVIGISKQLLLSTDTDNQDIVNIYDIEQQKSLAPIQLPQGEKINQVILNTNRRLAFLYNNQGEGRQIQVYDVEQQKLLAPIQLSEIQPLKGEKITAVTFSTNSRLIFLYDRGIKGSRQVQVYSIEQQKLLTPIQLSEIELAEEQEAINIMTFSTDGRLVFLYNYEEGSRQVQRYDVEQQKLLTPIQLPEGQKITQVTLSADNRLAFLYRWRGSRQPLQVYDIEQRKLLAPIAVPAEEIINQVIFSTDSRLAFLYNNLGNGRQIQVYDVEQSKLAVPIQLPEGEKINGVTLSADSRVAFLYGRDSRQVQVYDCQNKTLSPLIFEQPINDIHILQGVDDIVVCRSNYEVYIHNHQTRETFLLCQVQNQIENIHLFSANYLLVECYGRSYLQQNWRQRESKPSSTLETTEGHSSRIFDGIEMSETGYLSRSGSEVCIWQIQFKRMIFLHKFVGDFNEYQVTNNGQLVFLYSRDEESLQVHAYDMVQRKQLMVGEASTGEKIDSVILSADSRLAFLYACCFGSRMVQVYDVEQRKLLAPIQPAEGEKISQVILSADSRLAFLYDFSGSQVQVYDMDQRKLLAPIKLAEGEKVTLVIFSRDSQLAFLYDRDNCRQVQIYDMAQRKQLMPVKASSGEKISNIIFSTDNRLAFLAADNHQAQVYDIEQRKLLAPITVPEGEKISEVILSADSRLAFLYNGDKGAGQVQVYDMEQRKLLMPIQSVAKEKINRVTLSTDNRLAFLYNGDKSGGEVQVYDMEQQKLLAPIELTEGERIKQITFAADTGLAFLYAQGGSQVQLYDVEQRKQWAPIQLPKGVEIAQILLIPQHQKISSSNSEAKKTDEKAGASIRKTKIILHGSGSCFLWQSSPVKLIPLIEKAGVDNVNLLKGGTQLVTGGTDGVCRLWDITDPVKPLLKSCTRGMTLYAQGTKLESSVGLSTGNYALLKQKGALVKESSLASEVKKEKSKFVSSNNSSTPPLEQKINIDQEKIEQSSALFSIKETSHTRLFTVPSSRDEKARVLIDEVRFALNTAYPPNIVEHSDTQNAYLSQLAEYQSDIDSLTQPQKDSLKQLLTTLEAVIAQQRAAQSTIM